MFKSIQFVLREMNFCRIWLLTNRNTPMSGPVVAELVMSAVSITPGKKPVRYAIIVTKKAYTTATYLIVLSCALSS